MDTTKDKLGEAEASEARLAKYKDAARLYNELVADVLGADDEGQKVTRMTPVGGAALAMEAPTELRLGVPARVLRGKLCVEPADKAAEFLEAWAGWIRQEGAQEGLPATSLFDNACRPVVLRQAGTTRSWSVFGGAALAMERQQSLPLDGDSIPPVRMLLSLAKALRGLHEDADAEAAAKKV